MFRPDRPSRQQHRPRHPALDAGSHKSLPFATASLSRRDYRSVESNAFLKSHPGGMEQSLTGQAPLQLRVKPTMTTTAASACRFKSIFHTCRCALANG